jgi:hypothetical protein
MACMLTDTGGMYGAYAYDAHTDMRLLTCILDSSKPDKE